MRIALLYFTAMVAFAVPTFAAAQVDPDESMGKHAGDAVTQPLRDINIDKEDIPQKLLDIQSNPYALDGLGKCRALIAEVAELNAVLGPDIHEIPEKSRTEKREEGVSRVAGGIIGGFIPFRGLVREVTGANAARARFDRAVTAGFVRRSFLKGVGLQRRCKAPGRP
jgi:hypothetical protein